MWIRTGMELDMKHKYPQFRGVPPTTQVCQKKKGLYRICRFKKYQTRPSPLGARYRDYTFSSDYSSLGNRSFNSPYRLLHYACAPVPVTIHLSNKLIHYNLLTLHALHRPFAKRQKRYRVASFSNFTTKRLASIFVN